MEQAKLDRREFGLGAIGSGVALGLSGTSLAATTGAAEKPDRFALVDPELIEAARALPDFTVDARSLPLMRGLPGRPVAPAPAPQPQFLTVPGPKGAPDVRVMVIDGTGGKAGSPAYLHIHGGGFVGGRVDQYPAAYQGLAQACQCLLVSVDYRLAPETPFPGALEDNYAALRWLHGNAKALGVDPKRIAIGGESAGGGHAAMLAIAARDRGEFPIAFQLLVYPMLDDRTGSTVPPPAHVGQFVWNAGSNRFGWASLLGQTPGLRTVPAGSVPARVADLAGLPPAFIAVGGLDLFAAEDMAFAARLNAAGVPVEMLVVPGAFHAFDGLVPNARVSRQFRAAIVDALKRGTGVK
jgi:acetyl esterase/lipase